MSSRVMLQPAFVLHSRPYRNTSMLLDVFSLRYGRIGLIARGVRVSKSKVRGMLMPFVPLLLTWSGKSELQVLADVEVSGQPYNLDGPALLSGMYLNELLVRLLKRSDPHPEIYHVYQTVLSQLAHGKTIQHVLRLFEKRLLAAIGYGLQFDKDAFGMQIVASAYYTYAHEYGFVRHASRAVGETFVGKSLLALHEEWLDDSVALRDAKRLMRIVIQRILGDKPLKSRDLFC